MDSVGFNFMYVIAGIVESIFQISDDYLLGVSDNTADQLNIIRF